MTLWYLQTDKNRSVEQNRPKKYGQLVFDKGAKAIQRRKDNLSNMVLEQLHIHMERADTHINFNLT